jgi:hypothetical protein
MKTMTLGFVRVGFTPLKSSLICVALLLVGSLGASAYGKTAPQGGHVSGQYIENRTADVYTGPCFANAQVNLTGQQAVMGWHVDKGVWDGVALENLSVVAVVQASATLGDPYSDPLPAKTAFLVDQRASNEQRTALMHFAQAQSGGLLNDVVAVDAAPIRFDVDASRHGFATLEAGNIAKISTRALTNSDEICHNEEVFYPALAAHLTHAMPAVASVASYNGKRLGTTWNESNRRSAFVGTFAV